MPLLCVSSPKGGVGKTTLAANLAAELGRAGRKVIVLDLDPQNALGLHFGMALDRVDGFMTALGVGEPPQQTWRRCLQAGPAGVRYLPFGQTDMEGANAISLRLAVNPALLTAALQDMLADDTVVVVDAPPGPSLAVPILLPLADLLLVVLLVDATSIAQIPAVESGRAYGLNGPATGSPRIGFVLNQLDLRTRLGRASVDAASRHLGDRLLGVVYRDESVPEAVAAQKLVCVQAPASKAAQDIAALAATIGRLFSAGQTRQGLAS